MKKSQYDKSYHLHEKCNFDFVSPLKQKNHYELKSLECSSVHEGIPTNQSNEISWLQKLVSGIEKDDFNDKQPPYAFEHQGSNKKWNKGDYRQSDGRYYFGEVQSISERRGKDQYRRKEKGNYNEEERSDVNCSFGRIKRTKLVNEKITKKMQFEKENLKIDEMSQKLNSVINKINLKQCHNLSHPYNFTSSDSSTQKNQLQIALLQNKSFQKNEEQLRSQSILFSERQRLNKLKNCNQNMGIMVKNEDKKEDRNEKNKKWEEMKKSLGFTRHLPQEIIIEESSSQFGSQISPRLSIFDNEFGIIFDRLDKEKSGKLSEKNCGTDNIPEEVKYLFGGILSKIKYKNETFTLKRFIRQSKLNFKQFVLDELQQIFQQIGIKAQSYIPINKFSSNNFCFSPKRKGYHLETKLQAQLQQPLKKAISKSPYLRTDGHQYQVNDKSNNFTIRQKTNQNFQSKCENLNIKLDKYLKAVSNDKLSSLRLQFDELAKHL